MNKRDVQAWVRVLTKQARLGNWTDQQIQEMVNLQWVGYDAYKQAKMAAAVLCKVDDDAYYAPEWQVREATVYVTHLPNITVSEAGRLICVWVTVFGNDLERFRDKDRAVVA